MPHRFTVIDKIGREVEDSPVLQAVTCQVEEIRIDQAPFALAFFRPGIRAVDIDRLQAVRTQVAIHQVTGFHTHGKDIVQAGVFDAGTGLAAALIENIDGDEVDLRLSGSELDDKIADPATDFQGQRLRVVEQGSEATGFFQLRLRNKHRGGDEGHTL